MFYDVISELEVVVDRKAWEKWYASLGERVIASTTTQELLAEFLDTYTENIDYIDWEYSQSQFLVCLNEPIEETIAMKNQWRDYRDPEDEDVDLEDTF